MFLSCIISSKEQITYLIKELKEIKDYYSPGKLLLSAEYAILQGAEGLALALKYGQKLRVQESKTPGKWVAYDHHSAPWLELNLSSDFIAKRKASILGIFKALLTLGVNINDLVYKYYASYLEFNSKWGFGSSSTLISNMAKLFEVNPYELSKMSFGGSAYDVAVGFEGSSLIYKLNEEKQALVKTVKFSPPFHENLFFVYQGKKQNSRDAIRNLNEISPCELQEISSLSHEMLHCNDIKEWGLLLNIHEKIIGKIINQTPIRQNYFPNYPYPIKSLGAWGGDFMMCIGENKNQVAQYFKNKGLNTIFAWNEIIL